MGCGASNECMADPTAGNTSTSDGNTTFSATSSLMVHNQQGHGFTGGMHRGGGGSNISYVPSQIPTIIVTPPSLVPPDNRDALQRLLAQKLAAQQQQQQAASSTAMVAAEAGTAVQPASASSGPTVADPQRQELGGETGEPFVAVTSAGYSRLPDDPPEHHTEAEDASSAAATPKEKCTTEAEQNPPHPHATSSGPASRSSTASPDEGGGGGGGGAMSSPTIANVSNCQAGGNASCGAVSSAGAAARRAAAGSPVAALHTVSSRSHSSLTVQTAVISANRSILDQGGCGNAPPRALHALTHFTQNEDAEETRHPESPSVKPKKLHQQGGGGGGGQAPEGSEEGWPAESGGRGRNCGGEDSDDEEMDAYMQTNNEHVRIPGVDVDQGILLNASMADRGTSSPTAISTFSATAPTAGRAVGTGAAVNHAATYEPASSLAPSAILSCGGNGGGAVGVDPSLLVSYSTSIQLNSMTSAPVRGNPSSPQGQRDPGAASAPRAVAAAH